jgi:hypothetical protein
MSIHRFAFAAAILAGSLIAGSASAMPLGGLQTAAATVQVTPDNVGWVCGPYRCGWRPGPAYWGPGYGFYGPRFYGPRFRYGWYGPRRYWR